MLVLVPNSVVVTDGSDETTAPFKNQLILNGSSPFCTKHISCAPSPSFTALEPKLKGTICGGSEKNKYTDASHLEHSVYRATNFSSSVSRFKVV